MADARCDRLAESLSGQPASCQAPLSSPGGRGKEGVA